MADQQYSSNSMNNTVPTSDGNDRQPTTVAKVSPARLRFLGAAMLIIISLSAGFVGGRYGATRGDDISSNVRQQQVVLKGQAELISGIAKNVGASVVSVSVKSTSGTTRSVFGFSSPIVQESAGTGIILSADGLIITNRHVVPVGTTSVSVTLSDGTTFDDVQVLGRTSSSDPLDIAFLKVKDTKGKQLSPATIGDSTKMQVGDPVVAIGNALGQLQNTVTSGIISGFGRSVQASDATGTTSENLENLFQTDAAINEGNSGGPLVNLSGEVIGINTAIAGGDAQNIGFAIPINDVTGIIDTVQKKGTLERPFLGVVFVPITADIAKQYDLSVTRGAYIPPSTDIGQLSIISDSPAEKAGLKEKDIITKVDDDAIDSKSSLTSLLGKHQSGDTVELTVIREGKERTISVTLGTVPDTIE